MRMVFIFIFPNSSFFLGSTAFLLVDEVEGGEDILALLQSILLFGGFDDGGCHIAPAKFFGKPVPDSPLHRVRSQAVGKTPLDQLFIAQSFENLLADALEFHPEEAAKETVQPKRQAEVFAVFLRQRSGKVASYLVKQSPKMMQAAELGPGRPDGRIDHGLRYKLKIKTSVWPIMECGGKRSATPL